MFLTDGSDEHGNSTKLRQEIDTLVQNPDVHLKTIGFGSGSDQKKLASIAALFHERGEHMSAGDAVELVKNFEGAAAELSHMGKNRMSA
eukprot:3691834-Rhodomonas_salina.2